MCRMALPGSRIGTRNRFIECAQEVRVEFVTLIDTATFLCQKCRPRFQSDASEFIRRQAIKFRFNFGVAHGTFKVVSPVGMGK